jgi:hypothetical protein
MRGGAGRAVGRKMLLLHYVSNATGAPGRRR